LKLTSAVALLILFFAGTDPSGSTGPPANRPLSEPSVTLPLRPSEPPQAQITIGEPAPDFSYQTTDGSWRNLHDLIAQGPVLLVFGAKDTELKALEGERNALLDLGVVPVAVLDVKPRSASSLARKLALRYTVLGDSRHLIGLQFNTLDTSQNTVAAWFVVDRDRTVRGLWRGSLPDDGYRVAVARSLGLALPDAERPASN
jgi:peroxiredoxin